MLEKTVKSTPSGLGSVSPSSSFVSSPGLWCRKNKTRKRSYIGTIFMISGLDASSQHGGSPAGSISSYRSADELESPVVARKSRVLFQADEGNFMYHVPCHE